MGPTHDAQLLVHAAAADAFFTWAGHTAIGRGGGGAAVLGTKIPYYIAWRTAPWSSRCLTATSSTLTAALFMASCMSSFLMAHSPVAGSTAQFIMALRSFPPNLRLVPPRQKALSALAAQGSVASGSSKRAQWLGIPISGHAQKLGSGIPT